MRDLDAMPRPGFDRRTFLKMTGSLGRRLFGGGTSFGKTEERSRVLRVRASPISTFSPNAGGRKEWPAACNTSNRSRIKPNLILSGGDHVMDAVRQKRDRTQVQWDLWKNVLKAEKLNPRQIVAR